MSGCVGIGLQCTAVPVRVWSCQDGPGTRPRSSDTITILYK